MTRILTLGLLLALAACNPVDAVFNSLTYGYPLGADAFADDHPVLIGHTNGCCKTSPCCN